MDQFQILQCTEESLKKFDLQVKTRNELFTLINETFYKKPSKTSKEKFETLLLRDKILKLIRHEIQQNLAGNQILQGSCADMCPEKERFSREYLSLLHKYEYSPETQQPDHFLMIKEYSRSSADQDLPLPNEMRPLDILYDTMLYIIDDVISKIEDDYTEQFQYTEWYDFIWNRTRSIRKDIIQQRLLISTLNPSIDGVLIIEQCARFHIMCSYRLCDQPPEVFDFKMNEENLKNCFQSLRQYYETSHHMGTNLPECPNESEFKSYIILLNLTESNILSEIQRWPKQIRNSKYVQFALNCYFAFNSRNYVKFFRLVKSDDCEFLQACVLHRHFYKARVDAFRTVFSSFKENKEKVFPIAKLVEIMGFDDSDESILYANMFGLDVTDDGLSFRMRPNEPFSAFDLTKSDQDSLRLRRSKILVDNKFYLNHFYSNDLNKRDLLSVIISGLDINQVKSSRFLSPEHCLTSSFDEDGRFISNEIDIFLDELRQFKDSKPKPRITEFKKTPFTESLNREPRQINFLQVQKPEPKPEPKPENLFSKIIAPPKNPNLFASLIKKPLQPALLPQPPPPPPPAPIQIDINKIAEDIQSQILEETIRSVLKDLTGSYIRVSNDFTSLFIDLVLKENIRNCLVEECLEQQNLKYKNEALNRISVNLGEQILNESIQIFLTEYITDLRQSETIVYDEILYSVFQKEFDYILKQIANEISADMILDQLANKIYFDLESGLFNEDLLLTLHDTIYDTTRLSLNVNTELYHEIKSSLKENQKHLLFQKWRLKLSLKLLHKQHRRSMNQTINFLIKYASYLLQNLNSLYLLKPKLFQNVHCQSFLSHIAQQRLNYRSILHNILLDNYFQLINNETENIFLDIPQPVEEVNLKIVLYTTRPEVYKKFFTSGSTVIEHFVINVLDPREFGIKFMVKKFVDQRDFQKSNSIIFTIETFEPKFDLKLLNKFDHVMFISFFNKEKTQNFIEQFFSKKYHLCCPHEDKNYFLIDETFVQFVKEALSDRSNRSPNLTPISLRDLVYETLIKFLDNSKNLLLDQIVFEFDQRFQKLVQILLKESNLADLWPILEFISEEHTSLKHWGSNGMILFLTRGLAEIFRLDQDEKKPEYFRAFIEYRIENEKVNLGNETFSFEKLFIYADLDEIRNIDWVEKEELNRRYNLANIKRRLSNERRLPVMEKQIEEKSPKRLMLINEKVDTNEKMKSVDMNFDKFLNEFIKEKENNVKFESRLVDVINNEEEETIAVVNNDPVCSSFDNFMKKLNEEKSRYDKFNDKLNHILWK